jgi:hypothetical protein
LEASTPVTSAEGPVGRKPAPLEPRGCLTSYKGRVILGAWGGKRGPAMGLLGDLFLRKTQIKSSPSRFRSLAT